MLQRARKLYEKYLVRNCKFEINVPYDKKAKIIHIFELSLPNHNKNDKDKIDIFDILYMFDGCADEMWSLMQDSFNRFKNTEGYDTIKTLIFV